MDSTPANCALGPYAVMHAIADHVVDTYLEVTDLVEHDIDAMEENVFSPNSVTNIEHIYLLKREVVEMRRAVSAISQRMLSLTLRGLERDGLVTRTVTPSPVRRRRSSTRAGCRRGSRPDAPHA